MAFVIGGFVRSPTDDLCLQLLGVVHAGTATDGTPGPEAIKAEGGTPCGRGETALRERLRQR
jgi:hypothetical protein